MFSKLTELKNKMDNGIYPTIVVKNSEEVLQALNTIAEYKKDQNELFKPLEEVFSYIEDNETRNAVIEFVELARKYYNKPLAQLSELIDLYNREMRLRGSAAAKKSNLIDYFEQDETISSLAASVFDDEHFGSAITEAELDYREELKREYAKELAFAKVITQNNPNFEKLTYKNKINYIANIIVELHSNRNNTNELK